MTQRIFTYIYSCFCMVNVCINIPYMDFMGLKPQTCFFQIPIFPLSMGYVMTIWKVYDVYGHPFFYQRLFSQKFDEDIPKCPYSKPKSSVSTPSYWVSILAFGGVSRFQDEKDSPPIAGGGNLTKKTHPKQHGDIPFKWGCGRIFWGP